MIGEEVFICKSSSKHVTDEFVINGARYGLELIKSDEKEKEEIILFENGQKRVDYQRAIIKYGNNDENSKFEIGDVILIDLNAAIIIPELSFPIIREVDIILKENWSKQNYVRI